MPGNPKTSTVLAEATSIGAHKVAINHLEYRAKELVFSQGDRSDAVFFIERGKVKLTVVSRGGREAIIGFSGVNDFVGEQCMAGETSRAMSVTVVEDCSLLKIGRPHMPQILRQNPQLSFAFTSYLLSRNQRLYEELVDHFFNHSEKRLARILLSLANFGGASRVEGIFLRINQETLAEMVGTTRGRISFFMNKFRKEGFIEYKPNSGLYVRSALINVLLRE